MAYSVINEQGVVSIRASADKFDMFLEPDDPL